MTETTLSARSTTDPGRHAAPSAVSVDAPGRWLGGFVGGGLSLVFAGLASLVGGPTNGVSLDDSWQWVGLLGIPVGVVIGRAAMPFARSDGWRHAVGVGIGLGWLAPPLGAPLAVAFLGERWLCDPTQLVGMMVILPIALVVSFIAIVVTIPIGILWGLIVYAIPERWLAAARMPAPIDRLGARHLLVAVAIGLVAVMLTGTATCPATVW